MKTLWASVGRTCGVVCISSAVFAAPSTAFAQAKPRASAMTGTNAEAAERKKEGDDAFRSLRYADALRAYDASYKLVPNPALHFNRGRSLEALERVPEAIEAFETFLAQASPELRAKAGNLPDHVNELRSKVATLQLAVTPEGARVLVRNVAVGSAPLPSPLRVNAGSARIEVAAEGFVPYARDHDLRGGTTTKLSIALVARDVPRASTAAAGATSTPTETPSTEKSSSLFSRWWFWTGAGVVLAGAATAVVILSTKSPEPRSGDIGQLNAPLLRF